MAKEIAGTSEDDNEFFAATQISSSECQAPEIECAFADTLIMISCVDISSASYKLKETEAGQDKVTKLKTRIVRRKKSTNVLAKQGTTRLGKLVTEQKDAVTSDMQTTMDLGGTRARHDAQW